MLTKEVMELMEKHELCEYEHVSTSLLEQIDAGAKPIIDMLRNRLIQHNGIDPMRSLFTAHYIDYSEHIKILAVTSDPLTLGGDTNVSSNS